MKLHSFPLTKGLISEMIVNSRHLDDPIDWTIYYLGFLNQGQENSLIKSVHSCTESRGTALGFLLLEEVGYSIQINNAKTQSFSEQCFTICHEIAHICIAYELYKQNKFPSPNFTYPENLEDLCEEIAALLMREKDLL